MSAELPTGKRAYDAHSRRERAELERSDTRARVLVAARRRFLADGYAKTKMLDIAAEAGLAIAPVYRAGRSKAELIEMILEVATTGNNLAQSPNQPLTFAARCGTASTRCGRCPARRCT